MELRTVWTISQLNKLPRDSNNRRTTLGCQGGRYQVGRRYSSWRVSSHESQYSLVNRSTLSSRLTRQTKALTKKTKSTFSSLVPPNLSLPKMYLQQESDPLLLSPNCRHHKWFWMIVMRCKRLLLINRQQTWAMFLENCHQKIRLFRISLTMETIQRG